MRSTQVLVCHAWWQQGAWLEQLSCCPGERRDVPILERANTAYSCVSCASQGGTRRRRVAHVMCSERTTEWGCRFPIESCHATTTDGSPTCVPCAAPPCTLSSVSFSPPLVQKKYGLTIVCTAQKGRSPQAPQLALTKTQIVEGPHLSVQYVQVQGEGPHSHPSP